MQTIPIIKMTREIARAMRQITTMDISEKKKNIRKITLHVLVLVISLSL